MGVESIWKTLDHLQQKGNGNKWAPVSGVTGYRAIDSQQSGAEAGDPAWDQVVEGLECRPG